MKPPRKNMEQIFCLQFYKYYTEIIFTVASCNLIVL